jgi:hypothetical protein
MPGYKAVVALKATKVDHSDTVHLTIEANNAVHAKALLQDQYGEGAVRDVRREINQKLKLVSR